jgi:putative oxidoreductase
MNMYLEGVKQDDPAEGSIENVNVPEESTIQTIEGAFLRPLPEHWAPFLLSALRVIAAFLFVAHGTQKLFAFPVAEPQAPVELGSLIGLAGVIEVVGGTLLLLGLLSRPVAFILSGEMAVAYFLRHAPSGFWPALNGGELAALYCFVFLFVAAAGPGPWSLDSLLHSRQVHQHNGRPGHRG